MFIQCDVTRYNEQAAGFSSVLRKWGRVDAYCANAGIIDRGSLYVLKYRGVEEQVMISTADADV